MEKSLTDILLQLQPVAIALSGGVDSMTLAVLAHRLLGAQAVAVVHAQSPAVPTAATKRVTEWAAREGWQLLVIDAGEFENKSYRANPVNRCFFCKGTLYAAIRARTDRQILSGANMDDLGEYRPGLVAATDYAVRHPFVEAAIDKNGVRVLARDLGLGDIAMLPASPCLSSRVETRIRIEPSMLLAIETIEAFLTAELHPQTVRCRIRKSGVVIELDAVSLTALMSRMRKALALQITDLLPVDLRGKELTFELYRNGSAFVGDRL